MNLKLYNIELYAAAGIKLILSVGGATDHMIANWPTANIPTLVTKIVNFVVNYEYDGVDIDWEETAYFQSGASVHGEDWLIALTSQLRTALGNSYIITHAPQAPYLGCSYNGGTTAHYPRGGYLKVHQQVGDQIDWYNVQFYNQDTTSYTDWNKLFIDSGGWCEKTSVYQMIDGNNANGLSLPANKLVIGKYIRPGIDGFSGYIEATLMRDIFIQAITNTNGAYPEWNTGFMIWQFPGDAQQSFAWSNTVIEAWESYTSQPTQATPSPITSSPTSPTISTTLGQADGNLQLISNPGGSLGIWWFSGSFNGLPSGYSIKLFEIEHDNGWLTCTITDWNAELWQCQSTVAFVIPLSVRITAMNDEVITSIDVIQNYNAGVTWDLGDNFGASPITPAPITPGPVTPTPVTPGPVTPGPVTPGPVTPAPNTPAPVTPGPITPAPITPARVTPAPITPGPVTPAPHTPAPITPGPVTPAPVTPSPVTPAPNTPAPITPAPVTPAPNAPLTTNTEDTTTTELFDVSSTTEMESTVITMDETIVEDENPQDQSAANCIYSFYVLTVSVSILLFTL